jgi:hypothetical protein
MRTKILYFGCYEPLKAVRNLLLQDAGFDVVCSTNTVEASRAVANNDLEIILVCDTCEDYFYAQLKRSLGRFSLTIPILRLDEYSWRDPELMGLLIRAKLRQKQSSSLRKPPQSVQHYPLRKFGR